MFKIILETPNKEKFVEDGFTSEWAAIRRKNAIAFNYGKVGRLRVVPYLLEFS